MTLPGLMSSLAGAHAGRLIDTIGKLGLGTNLKLCLDAGDSASYTSGQKWLDRSGNGYDFYRGTGSGSEGSDPTFNGVAGGRSRNEYFSFDGSDWFTYDTTNETWMESLHKNSAIFSWVAIVYLGSGSSGIFGTAGNFSIPNDVGVALYASGGTSVSIDVDGGSTYTTTQAVGTVSGRWNVIGGAINEAANSLILNVNGTAYSKTCTYTSPTTTNANETFAIGAIGSAGNFAMPNGSRFAELAIWQGTALTAANLAALFAARRGKFGV